MIEDAFCTICLENVDSKQRFTTEECGHHFGTSCFTQYLGRARQTIENTYHETDDELRPQLDMRVPCPLCRTPLNDEQFVKLQGEH